MKLRGNVNENVELDKYEIGDESTDGIGGGNFYHIDESCNVSINGDIDLVDCIEFTPYEIPQDEDDTNSFEPHYEITASSINGDVIMYADLTIEELYDYFKQSVINDIVEKNARIEVQNGDFVIYRIDDLLSRETTPSNIDDVEEVNRIAKRIQTGGPSSYLLVDGEIISFQDHIYISNIDDMTPSKFVALGNIRLGVGGGIEVGKEPTSEQIFGLKQYIKRQDNIYLDIIQDSGKMYPNVICSATYFEPNPNRIINDIIYYFQDGIKPQGSMGFYENREKEKNILENINFEVDSSEVDLSSFKKQTNLAPNIWDDDDTLNSRVRMRLLDVADDFWEFVNLSWVKPKGIIITGSICNFNWSKFSDIDLHLIVDFKEIDEKTDFVKDYLDSKKNEWNETHKDLKIYDFPIELYTQDVDDELNASGVYDLQENKWVIKPNQDSIEPIGLNKITIKDKASQIMTIIDTMYDKLHETNDSHEIKEIGEDAKYLWKKLKLMRKKSLSKEGESGIGNIIWKVLRRTEYLNKLHRLSNIVYDKINSIRESTENKQTLIKEYLDKDYNLPLYKYFKWADTASSCEKAEDLAYQCAYWIKEYIPTVYYRYQEFADLLDENGEFDDEDEENIEKFLELLKKNKLCDHFISIMDDILSRHGLYNELPTWMNTRLIKIVKNQWCIHFGNDATEIAKEGFTSGTDNINRLAYTNAGTKKPTASYNFAFLINDRSVDFNEYGNEAVIFRTSGVEIYHYGDDQNQVIFYGPYAKDFIPIKYNGEYGDWTVEGQNGQILKMGNPSEIAQWATENLPQYRKQIMAGKNGYTPMRHFWDSKQNKIVKEPYPIFKNESIKKYLSLLKDNLIQEEFNGDGNTEHNPYKKRWETERKALKDFVCNFGTIMQSREDDKNGKLYKCFYDRNLSNLIGYNYCLCVQWDAIELKPKSIVYIRAWDKFTPNIRQVQFDTRGRDNQVGTSDDLRPKINYGNT